MKLEDGVRLHEKVKVELDTYARETANPLVKPFLLVIARDTTHAKQLHDQALAQLRSELAGMVVLAASRVLGREVDAEQHRALIERSLDEAATQLTDQG